MLPILLALIVFFTDCLVAGIVYNILSRKNHPFAIPIAGFIVLAGITSAVMVWLYMPMVLSPS